MRSVIILLSGLYDAVKLLLKGLAAVFLVISIFANFSSAFANTLGSLAKAVGTATVASALSETIQTKDKQLKTTKTELAQQKARISKASKHVKSNTSRIIKRTQRIVTRNIAALPTEVIPIVGIPTIVGLTAWEVVESCKTIKDLNGILISIGLEASEDDASQFCANAEREIAKAEKKVEKIKGKWDRWF